MKTRSRYYRLLCAIGSAAVVVGATTSSALAESPSPSQPAPAQIALASHIENATSEAMAQIEGMIDDAMQDRMLDWSERRLILRQAERMLSGTEFAEIEARLAKLPAPNAADDAKQATTANAGSASAALCCKIEPCCEESGCGGVLDNVYIFTAVDGWKGPIDDDGNNNFGIRTGFNMGVPVSEKHGIGAQFGMSYGVYDFHGRDSLTESSAIEDQLFFTTGLFHRSNLCGDPCWTDRISWGLVYDFMIADNAGEGADEWKFSQLRGQIGYALDCQNEVGIMASFGIGPDRTATDGICGCDPRVDVIDQGSLFWHHKWCWGADTRLYTGIAENPGDWVFGGNGEVPISPCWSLFGGFTYILPSTSGGAEDDRFAEEVWNVSAGVAFYPGGNARSRTVSGLRWMPLLPVADNGTFALEANPGQL